MDLDDDSVDGVLCRWGYMLMSDRATALAETRRVLRDGGRLSLSVWGAAERNPWASLPAKALTEHTGAPPANPKDPGIYAMADPERVRSLVQDAGSAEPRLDEVGVRWRFEDCDAYWRYVTELAGGIAMVLQAMPETDRELRRVATLIARAANAEEVFSAVAEEVASVLGLRVVTVCRYEVDAVVVLSSLGIPAFPAGSRWPLDDANLPGSVYRTGGPVRIDDFTDDLTGAVGIYAMAHDGSVKSALGAPIVVDGAVWGSVNAASTEERAFPADAEERLARFTDLVATSVQNATMRDQLAASRARVIAAADESRRRIERDLHDGAQQQLVTLALDLRMAEAKIPSGLDELRADVGRVAQGLNDAMQELREMSRGIHPAVLTLRGLAPALETLGRRSAVEIELDVRCEQRLPDRVEVAAYYTVAEALTNASKHSGATRAWVSVRKQDGALQLSVRDDGAGGADPTQGTGLIGLRDRVEALGGTIEIDSPPGRGTRIDVAIPVCPPSG